MGPSNPVSLALLTHVTRPPWHLDANVLMKQSLHPAQNTSECSEPSASIVEDTRGTRTLRGGKSPFHDDIKAAHVHALKSEVNNKDIFTSGLPGSVQVQPVE